MVNMTTRIQFTPEIINTLNYERYHHPVPLVQRRMWALWLKSNNLPHGLIAKLVGVTENTIREYFELFIEGSVEKLKGLISINPRVLWLNTRLHSKRISVTTRRRRSKKRRAKSKP